jgi:hypothetical protein
MAKGEQQKVHGLGKVESGGKTIESWKGGPARRSPQGEGGKQQRTNTSIGRARAIWARASGRTRDLIPARIEKQ